MPARTLLADDHTIFREGLRALLEREGLKVIGEASDGLETVMRVRELRPDIVILDLSMPLLNGIGATREILVTEPKAKVIILTMHTEEQYVLEALRAGARGYVLKSRAVGELVQAIRDVSKGMFYLSSGISRAVVEAFLHKTELPPDPLSPREGQVLQLVAEGKTIREVAALLGVSVKTAEAHRARIMAKLDIHETAGLVRYATRRGLVQP